MFGILISAAMLAGAVHFVAKDQAEMTFWKLIGIAAGISIVGGIALILLAKTLGLIGFLIWIPLLLLGTAWAIQQFLYLTWGDAIISAIVYVVAQILWSVIWRLILGPETPPPPRG